LWCIKKTTSKLNNRRRGKNQCSIRENVLSSTLSISLNEWVEWVVGCVFEGEKWWLEIAIIIMLKLLSFFDVYGWAYLISFPCKFNQLKQPRKTRCFIQDLILFLLSTWSRLLDLSMTTTRLPFIAFHSHFAQQQKQS
jgi:hypothetical protein